MTIKATPKEPMVDLTKQVESLKGMVLTMHPGTVLGVYLACMFFQDGFTGNKQDSGYREVGNFMNQVRTLQPEVHHLAQTIRLAEQTMQNPKKS